MQGAGWRSSCEQLALTIFAFFRLTSRSPFGIMMRGRTAADFLKAPWTMAVVLKWGRVRVAFTWAVAALFGTVMVCGEWLHCLSESQHYPHLSQSCCGVSEGASCGCDSCDDLSFVGPSSSHCHAAHGDCAICVFLVQAHCLPVVIAGISESGRVVQCCCVSPRVVLPAPACVYRSRAPPA